MNAGSMRLCRTAAQCFQAGWDDGATDKPLSQAEIDRLIVLLRPPKTTGSTMRESKPRQAASSRSKRKRHRT